MTCSRIDRKRRHDDIEELSSDMERICHVDESRRMPDKEERRIVVAPVPVSETPKRICIRPVMPFSSDIRFIGKFGIPLIHTKLLYTREDVERIIQTREEIMYPAYTRLVQDVATWKACATVALAEKEE